MTVPEMLTGEFTPDAAGHWQPEWGEDGDRHVDFGGEPQPWHSRNGGFDAEGRPRLDQTPPRLRTLREYLLEQIGADLSDQSDRVIALHLLDLLDEDGYLRAGLDEVTRLLGCGKGLEPATHSLGLKVVSRQMFHRHPVVNRPASGTTGASMGGKGIKCGRRRRKSVS